jgi:hypothetical protein
MALTQSPDGDRRPSRLALDRYHTGELDPDELASLEGRLDAGAREHLAALEAARTETPRPDWAEIRRRAALGDTGRAVEVPAPANDGRGFRRWLGPLFAVAAAAVALLVLTPRGTDPDYVGVKAGEQLSIYQLSGEVLTPYEPGTALGEDDVVGFKVAHVGQRGVVLLSVDGTGTISQFHPEAGDEPLPLPAGEDGIEIPLPGTVILDGAPGPEVFVAVFDVSVSEARAELARRFQSGGHAAVTDWADHTEGVVAVEVPRR